MKKTGWIILGVIVVLVLWVFSGYNGMVGSASCRYDASVG